MQLSSDEEEDAINRELEEIDRLLNVFCDDVRMFGQPGGKPKNRVKTQQRDISSSLGYVSDLITQAGDPKELKIKRWRARQTELQERYNALSSDFEMKVSSSSPATSTPVVSTPPVQTEEGMLSHARDIHQKTESSFKRSSEMMSLSVETATETTTKLQEQGEQLERIQDTLIEMESDLERGKKIVKEMFRRVWSDKCLVVLLLVLVLGIAGVVIWSLVSGPKKK